MKNQEDQIHLRNMLSCIHEIENNCVDLDYEKLKDDQAKMMVYRNLTMLGLEANRVMSKHKAVQILKSFAKADYINGLGKDVYALANFIANDLEYLKNSLHHLLSKMKENQPKRELVVA